jgi:hypothetical protein
MRRVAFVVLPLLLTACSAPTKAVPKPVASSTSPTSVAAITGDSRKACATPIATVRPAEVPQAVRAWAHGQAVVGHGALWTLRGAIDNAGTPYERGWLFKIPWFTRPFGLPRIDATRLDGTGSFRPSVHRATDEAGTFVTSSLIFSTAGCWQVTSRFDDSVVRFRLPVGTNT